MFLLSFCVYVHVSVFLVSWLCVLVVLYLVSVVSVLSLCLLCMVFVSLVGSCVLCPYCLSRVYVSCWCFVCCLLFVIYWSIVCCPSLSCLLCVVVVVLGDVLACRCVVLWCCPGCFCVLGLCFWCLFWCGWVGWGVLGVGVPFFKGRCFSGILAANKPQTLYPSIIE